MPLPDRRAGLQSFAWGLQGHSTSLLSLHLSLSLLARQGSTQPVILFQLVGFGRCFFCSHELLGAHGRTGLSWRWRLRIQKILILQAQPVTPSPAAPCRALAGCRRRFGVRVWFWFTAVLS